MGIDVSRIKFDAAQIAELHEDQRRFIRDTTFQPIDYSLGSIVQLINQKELIVDPDFQRRDRWKKAQQSRLIESFFLNIPVPPIFVMSEGLGKMTVIDGQQRLLSIAAFFHDELKLTGLGRWKKLNNLYYKDLQAIGLSSILAQRPLRVFELRSDNAETIYDVFSRLNTGGVKLNNQEIRNSTFAKYQYNKLIKRLGEDADFWGIVGITNHKTERWKNMENCELVLRYFAIRGEGYTRLSHSVDEFLNLEMKSKSKEMSSEELKQLENDFLNTVQCVKKGLGKVACRNPERPKKFMVSAYEAVMHAFDGKDQGQVEKKSQELRAGYNELWKDIEYSTLFSKGTNEPKKLAIRIQRMDEMVNSILSR